MASDHDSYRPRNTGFSTFHCERRAEDDGCWGHVRMTGSGYRCEGHRKPSDYHAEPRPLTDAEIAAIKQQQAEEEARKQAEREALRWFRPIEDKLPDAVPVFWTMLSEPVLAAVFSMVGEGIGVGDGNEAVKCILWDMAHQVAAEVKHRGMEWPRGYYALKLAPKWDGPIGSSVPGYHDPFDPDTLKMEVHLLPDDHLHALYGCAGQVEDYSCLERGARQVAHHVGYATREELKKRGIEPEWLFDWEPT